MQPQLVQSLEKFGCKNNPEFLINASASAILIKVMFFLDTTHALIKVSLHADDLKLNLILILFFQFIYYCNDNNILVRITTY